MSEVAAGSEERVGSERAEGAANGAESPHFVRLYEREAELAQAVAAFLADGLGAGERLLVIAVADHRGAILRALAERGIDVEHAQASSELTLLDADTLLARFMRGGRPDRELFSRELRALLDQRPAGTRVRAYGEMVDVLWSRGEVAAALRLEELWDELQRSHDFSLLCAYALAGFYKQPDGLRSVCTMHSHVLANHSAPRPHASGAVEPERLLGEHARALTAEIARRMEIESTLRVSLREMRAAEERLQRGQRELLDVTNTLPVLVCHVDAEQRYTFVNAAYARWFGSSGAELLGKRVRDVIGAEGYADMRDRMEEALSGKTVRCETRVPHRGGERFIEATYIPRYEGDGRVCGFVGLIADITDRKRSEHARELTTQRVMRLMKITAAIADAVSPEQVYEAVVDQVCAALSASSAGLWRLHEDERSAVLLRSVGYAPATRERLTRLPLDARERIPVLDAIAEARPLWLDSQAELLERYPHLQPVVTEGRSYRIACLPVAVQDHIVGALGFTFEGEAPLDGDERDFMMLVARYSGQALERLRLLEAEQRSRARAEAMQADNERARLRAELLYGLAAAANAAERIEQVFEPALDAIERALGATRSSILAFDADGVMRFKAWRGLSGEYRRAVEGHSPWTREERSPVPIVVADAANDPALAAYTELFRTEGIAALAFIPLVAGGRLIGKFMVYYPRPHALVAHELELATAIANHVAAAIDRFKVIAELQRTVHFNEMFTGMLGHDLRNPLGAIMTAAQLAITRDGSERLLKPLSRILTSGTRMARMIDQLLDFTRVRVGAGIPIDPRPFELAPLLRQVIDELEDAHPESRIELESAGDSVGTWDADRLLQVFSNLVANAVQHGKSGVHVRVDGSARHAVIVQVHNAGTVPESVLPRLFEPMAGGEQRRDRSQGLGLGLFISGEIVKAHGGTIAVRSSPAEGTTFTVSLPRAGAAERA